MPEKIVVDDMPNAQGKFTFRVFADEPVKTRLVTITMKYVNPRWMYTHRHTVTCDALYISANTDLHTKIQVIVDGEEKLNFQPKSFAEPLVALAKVLLKDHHSMHCPKKV